MAICFGKIAPIKYRIKTKINQCSKVIFSCLKNHKTDFHDFLYATLLYVTPGWDLIPSVLFINKKQCFPSFLQENNRGGGGVESAHCKWCANDILKIMSLLPSTNKNFPFLPLCNLLLLTFWHSSFYWVFCIPSHTAYVRKVFPFPYQKGRDKGVKLWLTNWIPKAPIKPSKSW